MYQCPYFYFITKIELQLFIDDFGLGIGRAEDIPTYPNGSDLPLRILKEQNRKSGQILRAQIHASISRVYLR